MDYFDYTSDGDGFLNEVEAWDFDVEQFLEDSLENQQERLERELERIELIIDGFSPLAFPGYGRTGQGRVHLVGVRVQAGCFHASAWQVQNHEGWGVRPKL